MQECEGNDMMLMCPEATEIRIIDGFFGRSDNTTCRVSILIYLHDIPYLYAFSYECSVDFHCIKKMINL